MADTCPICQRSLLASDREIYLAERHCPRVDTSILGHVTQQQAQYDCLALGYDRLENELAQRDATIRAQSLLLGRARVLCTEWKLKLEQAIEELGQEGLDEDG